MRQTMRLLTVLLLLLGTGLRLSVQGTAFAYKGQLSDGAPPLTSAGYRSYGNLLWAGLELTERR